MCPNSESQTHSTPDNPEFARPAITKATKSNNFSRPCIITESNVAPTVPASCHFSRNGTEVISN